MKFKILNQNKKKYRKKVEGEIPISHLPKIKSFNYKMVEGELKSICLKVSCWWWWWWCWVRDMENGWEDCVEII